MSTQDCLLPSLNSAVKKEKEEVEQEGNPLMRVWAVGDCMSGWTFSDCLKAAASFALLPPSLASLRVCVCVTEMDVSRLSDSISEAAALLLHATAAWRAECQAG